MHFINLLCISFEILDYAEVLINILFQLGFRLNLLFHLMAFLSALKQLFLLNLNLHIFQMFQLFFEIIILVGEFLDAFLDLFGLGRRVLRIGADLTQ